MGKKKYVTKKKLDKELYRMVQDNGNLFFDALDEIEALKKRVAELEGRRVTITTIEGIQDVTVEYRPVIKPLGPSADTTG